MPGTPVLLRLSESEHQQLEAVRDHLTNSVPGARFTLQDAARYLFVSSSSAIGHNIPVSASPPSEAVFPPTINNHRNTRGQ
jgi:hypothetical protein